MHACASTCDENLSPLKGSALQLSPKYKSMQPNQLDAAVLCSALHQTSCHYRSSNGSAGPTEPKLSCWKGTLNPLARAFGLCLTVLLPGVKG